MKPLLNRKFHISQISHCEKLIPILHIFHTNISHFVKYAHVVKLFIAYMRNLHIDKIPPKLLHFTFNSNSSHICQDFITWLKQVTDKFHMMGQELECKSIICAASRENVSLDVKLQIRQLVYL